VISLPLRVPGQPLPAFRRKRLRPNIIQALGNRFALARLDERMRAAKAGQQKLSGPNIPQIVSQLPTRRYLRPFKFCWPLAVKSFHPFTEIVGLPQPTITLPFQLDRDR
jgi:hypothetical protein